MNFRRNELVKGAVARCSCIKAFKYYEPTCCNFCSCNQGHLCSLKSPLTAVYSCANSL